MHHSTTLIHKLVKSLFWAGASAALFSTNAFALDNTYSNKLLLTGGVSQIEGAAGGGLTPWAVIGGYGISC